jgi:hypothetical protein
LVLEAYPPLHTGDAQQGEFVRHILLGAAINLGMPPTVQGHGLPWRRSRRHPGDERDEIDLFEKELGAPAHARH